MRIAVLFTMVVCLRGASGSELEAARDRQDRPALEKMIADLSAAAAKQANDAPAQYRLALAQSYLAEVAIEVKDKAQAKTLASSYRGRLSLGNREGTRPGETAFAVPIRLKMTTRGNVREGPGTGFPISFAAESGTLLTGYSYADEWIRVGDETGRSGWVFRNLVGRPD